MIANKINTRGIVGKKLPFMWHALIAAILIMASDAKAQQPAFPGAEGFGKYAKGGRGGNVYEVTNLNDAGAGSFRNGVTMAGTTPLTVVFRVSGIITLQSNIKISRSNLTIAGQTAPGDGICLKGYSLILNGAKIGGNHGDIIIRFIRSRPGGTVSTGLYGFDMENCQNVIVDHCSFSWANEENAAMYDTKNVTVQYCIVSEGLYSAGHAKGVRSYCGVWGGQFASYHHNLIAHNVSRTVRFNGSRAHDTLAIIDYRNNVIYNWGSSGACYGGEVLIPGGVSQVNMVNNYYKPGPATSTSLYFVRASYEVPAYGTGQWYANGNIMVGDAGKTADNWLGVDVNNNPVAERPNAKSLAPFDISAPIPEESAQAAYQKVLDSAGAIFPVRDATDQRIVSETAAGTATGTGTYGKLGIIDAPTAVGGYATYNSTTAPVDADHDGMADSWELSRGLNPNDASDRNVLNSDGYTMLEVYLNGLLVSTTLPAKVSGFEARLLQGSRNETELSWKASNEQHVHNYVIERSNDGNKFVAVGAVAARNTTATHSYSFIDKNVPAGISYYRLKQNDIDGKFEYSRTVVVELSSKAGINFYPNPVGSSLTLLHPVSNSKAPIQLIAADGKVVKTTVADSNSDRTSMDVSLLNPGMYLINYGSKTNTLIIKFIKN
jgi:hypothetical protein